MDRQNTKKFKRRATSIAMLASIGALLSANTARSDEGGVSFWLPGQLASFAALPGTPGLSVPVIYYHSSVDAGGQKNFVLGGNLVAGIDARADLVFFAPTYVFAQPVAGGQAAVTLG